MEPRFDQSQDFDVGFEESQESIVTIDNTDDLEALIDETKQINVLFDEDDGFGCDFSASDSFECDFDKDIAPDEYQGVYEVTPTASEQYLQTANKTLKQNVTVHSTPYYEASNEQGGYTVTIL